MDLARRQMIAACDRAVKGFAAAAMLLFFVASSASLGRAAQPGPLPIPAPSTEPGVSSYQVKRIGSFEVAPLNFHGVRLFDVAAPALQDPKAFPPVAARIDLINDNLHEIVPQPTTLVDLFRPAPTRYDPDTFSVQTKLANGYWTLFATDQSGAPQTALLTVTELDAKYNGVPQDQLAQSWAAILQAVLGEALRQRAPGAMQNQILGSVLALLGAAALTLLIIGIRLGLAVIRRRLAPAADPMPWWRQFFLESLDLVDWLLAWSIGVAWAVAVLWALYQFSPTQAFARTLTRELGLIFLVWFAAGIASRIASIAIARFVHVWQLRPFGMDEDSARRHLRAKTIQSALEYAFTALIVIVGVGITLSALGASASAVVTVGAAFAFAVSFGAQSLVKDFVNGFFILIEDQYAIGDFVTIGGVEGFVNDLTLRITRLRSGDARLITIPNSQVAVVENWTKNYSRLDYRIAVSFDCDLERALRVFTDVLNEVAQDPHWRSLISEPPKILGVDSVASTGAVLLGQIRTSPGVMFELRREINRRMLTAFAAQGIPLGMPTSRAAPVATSPKAAQDVGTQQPTA